MLVDGTEIQANMKNSCLIPIMKQEFGDQKTQMKQAFKNTWLLGTQVMNKYYTVFDKSIGYNEPHVLLAQKNTAFDRK